MLGNSGLFLNLFCPFDKNCDRPYCQFKHSFDCISQRSSLIQSQFIEHKNNFNDYEHKTFSNNSIAISQDFNNSTSKNVVIQQEEPEIGNCYLGYVASVEPSNKIIKPTSEQFSNSINNNEQNYLYNGISTDYQLTFSKMEQSIYAPEDPIVQIPLLNVPTTESMSSYVLSHQQSTSNQLQTSNKFTNLKKTSTIPCDPRLKRKRTECLSNINAKLLPKRANFTKQSTEISSTLVYIPTPIAELERQKQNANERRLQKEKINNQFKLQLEKHKDNKKTVFIQCNRSPEADEFSIIERFKLPINLADDEILNSVRQNNFKKLKSVEVNKNQKHLKKEDLVKENNFKKSKETIAATKSCNIMLTTSSKSNAQKKITSENSLTKQPNINNKIAILNKQKTDLKIIEQNSKKNILESFEVKQTSRLTDLNNAAREIAKIDEQIARKKKEMACTLLANQKNDKKIFKNKMKKSNEMYLNNMQTTTSSEIDIESLFEDKQKNYKKCDKINANFSNECNKNTQINNKYISVNTVDAKYNEISTNYVKPTILSKSILFDKSKILKDQIKKDNCSSVLSEACSSTTKNIEVGEKGQPRIARIPNFLTVKGKKLAPLDIYNKKITYSVRIKYLQRIYEEYKKICNDNEECIEKAINEEKGVIDRVNTQQTYTSSIVNVIRKIRCATKKNLVNTSVTCQQMSTSTTVRNIKIYDKDNKNVFKELFDENFFYQALCDNYVLRKEFIIQNGFPRWADETHTKVDENSHGGINKPRKYAKDNELSRVCFRCGTEYRLTVNGNYVAEDNSCTFHWGRLWKYREKIYDPHYTCCNQDSQVKGCVASEFHVTETQLYKTLFDFKETPKSIGVGDKRSKKVYALDCEMVYGVWGAMLARVSLVDVFDELVLDEIVAPEYKLVDPNTRFSGLTMEQLNAATCTFNEARERLFEFVNEDTILIGHSLDSDLHSLRIIHNKIVDTSVVFPHPHGFPKKRALKTIAFEFLGKIIQENVGGHDSKEDASACMKLMLYKVAKKI